MVATLLGQKATIMTISRRSVALGTVGLPRWKAIGGTPLHKIPLHLPVADLEILCCPERTIHSHPVPTPGVEFVDEGLIKYCGWVGEAQMLDAVSTKRFAPTDTPIPTLFEAERASALTSSSPSPCTFPACEPI